jgi:hypothetical protein
MLIIIRKNNFFIYNEKVITNDTIKYQLYHKEFLELKKNNTFVNYFFEKILIIRPVKYVKFEYYD